MSYEIERKFLVSGEFKSHAFASYSMQQGYLLVADLDVVRVRIRDKKAFLTIKKSIPGNSLKRHEWEYEIPVSDAEEMLQTCKQNVIEKTRYLVRVGNHVFEVDEFKGNNKGLFLAEVELQTENESFEKPEWLGTEVTGNERYYNSYLSTHPYKEWEK